MKRVFVSLSFQISQFNSVRYSSLDGPTVASVRPFIENSKFRLKFEAQCVDTFF